MVQKRRLPLLASALSALGVALTTQQPAWAVQPYIFSSSINNLAANVPSGTAGTGDLTGSFDFTSPLTVSNWNVIVDGTVDLGDLPDFTFTPSNSNFFYSITPPTNPPAGTSSYLVFCSTESGSSCNPSANSNVVVSNFDVNNALPGGSSQLPGSFVVFYFNNDLADPVPAGFEITGIRYYNVENPFTAGDGNRNNKRTFDILGADLSNPQPIPSPISFFALFPLLSLRFLRSRYLKQQSQSVVSSAL